MLRLLVTKLQTQKLLNMRELCFAQMLPANLEPSATSINLHLNEN